MSEEGSAKWIFIVMFTSLSIGFISILTLFVLNILLHYESPPLFLIGGGVYALAMLVLGISMIVLGVRDLIKWNV